MGVPQIAAIMGSCVAGGAYLPILCDESIIVENTGSVLASSHLVKAAIGEDIDNDTLGGAKTHSEISGVTDYKCKNDKEALKLIRDLIEKIPLKLIIFQGKRVTHQKKYGRNSWNYSKKKRQTI